jgi:hypothetical protein
VVLVGLAAAGPAAGAGTVPVRLDFVSHAGCGTGAELARRVAMRSARIAFSDTGSGHHVVRVKIEQSATGRFDTTLTFSAPAGPPSSRRVDTSSCDEALDSAALILAVTLDPTPSRPPPKVTPPDKVRPSEKATPSDRSAVPVGEKAAAPSEVAPATPAPGTSGDVERKPDERKPDERKPDECKPDERKPDEQPAAVIDQTPPAPVIPPAAESESTFTLSAGVDGRVAAAPSPATMFGAGLYVLGGWDRASVWSPRVRISATYFPERRVSAEGGMALFSLGLAALDVCPIWLRLGAFGLGGCADVTGGWVTARGTETFSPQTRRLPFGAAGASAAVTWEPGWSIEVVGFVNGGISLVRDRFQFDPFVFHEVPRLTLTAGVGVGVRFW